MEIGLLEEGDDTIQCFFEKRIMTASYMYRRSKYQKVAKFLKKNAILPQKAQKTK